MHKETKYFHLLWQNILATYISFGLFHMTARKWGAISNRLSSQLRTLVVVAVVDMLRVFLGKDLDQTPLMQGMNSANYRMLIVHLLCW